MPPPAKSPKGESRLPAALFSLATLLVLCALPAVKARAGVGEPTQVGGQATGAAATQQQTGKSEGVSANPEAQLQTGIHLTRQGHFADAIPYLLAARGHVTATEEFAAGFDLSLCYVGTRQFKKAIPILLALREENPGAANVGNLLAQAYIGAQDEQNAFNALRRAATSDPRNEKLYLYAADACLENHSYALGLRVADLGLASLPQSAKLHYERGVFLSELNRSDLATQEFHLATKYGAGTAIAYMGAAQAALLDGKMPEAASAAREGLKQSPDNYVLLAILGQALVRSGVSPGQPEFTEALNATEKAVAQQPNHPVTQVELGNLYLMAGQLDKAIVHLEKARTLDPQNTAVYAHLAAAYRRKGNIEKVKQMLAILMRLNQEKAASYRTGSGQERSGYVGGGMKQTPPEVPHPR